MAGADWIDKKTAQIRPDPEASGRLICNQPIASGMFLVHGHRPIDNFDLIAVHCSAVSSGQSPMPSEIRILREPRRDARAAQLCRERPSMAGMR